MVLPSIGRKVMTSLFEWNATGDTHSAIIIESNENIPVSYQNKYLVISKEKTFKPKCSKALKKKLRKYKLRRDGKEDQDVLNISKTLLSSLQIKSPNNQIQVNESEELIPKNYLFKMVRRKNTTKIDNSEIVIKTQKQKHVQKEEVTPPTTKIDNSEIVIKTHKQKHVKKEEVILPGNNNEEKKQTNAFKLLMDSRNKSIGSNSPGKEKVVDDYEVQEIFDKKSIKAKRNLVLQKMAEAKGSIRKKEFDEYQENCIKIKLEKRAEKFKSMLLNKDGKMNEESKIKTAKLDGKNIEPNLPDKLQSVAKGPKTLQLFNMFNDSGNSSNCISPPKRLLPEEDEEFLKKLSPSMRKKENMLCYFNKVEKEPENIPIDDENKIIIKVKVSSKGKKRGRKKKASINHDILNLDPSSTVHDEKNMVVVETLTPVNNSDLTTDCFTDSYVGRKRKRKANIVSDNKSNNNVIIETDINEPTPISETRPKRGVKKPIKYNDDVYISGSDDDLHIFTPKKKKLIENNNSKLKVDTKPERKIKIKLSETKTEKTLSLQYKPTKLAPIFAVKAQVDIAAIEAKQKFLQSGVPDLLKRNIAQLKQKNDSCNDFFEVVHVQQNNTIELPLSSQFDYVFGIDYDDENIDNIKSDDNLFEKLIKLSKCDRMDNNPLNFARIPINVILHDMKQSYPMFPVFRTFRLLSDKSKGVLKDLNYRDLDNSIELINGMVDSNNDNPDKLTWTDKYKATSSKQIIGNFESIKELRKWLEYWTINEIRAKVNGNPETDSSDFCESDTDSRDGRVTNNLLILTGPVGSGKTSSVYAVAAELAMKVIEVNASNKRTGKIMLQDLQEATQSHKVNRSTENPQKSQELINTDLEPKKKRGRPKKINKTKSDIRKKCDVLSGTSASQETIRTAVSLILIDDADIVFEQDDGFTSAIMQLVQCSKRPVILVTGSLACPHLQRFVQSGKILKFNPLTPKVLGTWLDIMCLADNGISQPGLGAKFLNFFKGDIRKTINCLQFYVSTHTQDSLVIETSHNSDNCNQNIEAEENSNLSWADRENWEESEICTKKSNIYIDSIWKSFIDKQINLLQFKYPLELLNIWWTLPSLIRNPINNSKIKEIKNQDDNKIMCEKIDSIAIAIDAISVSDYFNKNKPDTNINITSQPWDLSESDNVSELENLDYFNRNYQLTDEISHNLVTTAIIRAQNTLELDSKADIHFPGMTVQREKDRIISRHKKLSSYLNPSAVFDRRALALDYWSSCRNICRIEKAKPDINSKRNNRYCHYLKSLNVQCNSDTFEKLSESLGSSGKCDWDSFYE